jgi:hypothetical protein
MTGGRTLSLPPPLSGPAAQTIDRQRTMPAQVTNLKSEALDLWRLVAAQRPRDGFGGPETGPGARPEGRELEKGKRVRPRTRVL